MGGSPTEKDWWSDVRREDINFRYILNYQIFTIVKSWNLIEDEMAVHVFSNSVMGLEILLYDYLDKKYLEAIKRLENLHPKSIREIIPKDDDRFKLYSYQINSALEAERLRVTIFRERERWRELMRLMARKNLLLERQSYEEVEPDAGDGTDEGDGTDTEDAAGGTGETTSSGEEAVAKESDRAEDPEQAAGSE